MFKTGVLTRNRARNSRSLPHTLEVYDINRTEFQGGNFWETLNPLYTLGCRKAPADIGASPNENIVAKSDQSQVRWWVILAWDSPEMNPRFKFVVRGKDSDNSPEWTVPLEILAVMTKRSNRIMGKILCMERQ